MIYLEIGASMASIVASVATIVSCLKTRKKRIRLKRLTSTTNPKIERHLFQQVSFLLL